MSERLNREFRYFLRQSPGLSDAERAFLALVSSYKHGCYLTQPEIGAILGWSVAKIKRVQSDLLAKMLIEVNYKAYKKTRILIAPAVAQKAFADHQRASLKLTHELSRQLTHEPMIAHQRAHDSSPMSYPIKERELERKLERSPLDMESEYSPPPPEVFAFAENMVKKLAHDKSMK